MPTEGVKLSGVRKYGWGLRMDAALENLILSTEGARKTSVFRISQVKGRSK